MRSARERESLATVQDARRSCKLRKRCDPQLDVREPHGVIVPVLLLAVTVTPELYFFFLPVLICLRLFGIRCEI